MSPKIRISRNLHERLKTAAADQGYSSVEELVRHALEKAASEAEEDYSEEAVRERLRGLGYLR